MPTTNDNLMGERIRAQVMSSGDPVTLSNVELELDREPLTKPSTPRPVRVWLRYGEKVIMTDAEAVAWTAYAVAVQWTTPAGEQHRAWVWASAVRGA
jgi:hypothetical protein